MRIKDRGKKLSCTDGIKLTQDRTIPVAESIASTQSIVANSRTLAEGTKIKLKSQSRLFIVANAGRSGSTFLWNLLKANNIEATVLHEDIPVQVSRPRQFNRAYDEEKVAKVLQDPALSDYFHRWEKLLEDGDVIETGWTTYHLLPVLHERFGDRLHLVVLHRDPWPVALSRANMGNYHRRTWYDAHHEVSPYDSSSIAHEYIDQWSGMNHAEKCLFWWFIIYREIDEFIGYRDCVPKIEISAESLFRGDGIKRISEFLRTPLGVSPNLERNPVQKFMLETFPISDEYKAFDQHARINEYAKKRFGYNFDPIALKRQARKYSLPQGIMPRLRHSVDYWSHRRKLGRAVRSLMGQ